MAKLPEISINAVNYPCDAWEVVQQGRALSRSFTKGFIRGMSQFALDDPRRYYHCVNADPTAAPWVRVRPQLDFDIVATNADPLKPVYVFLAEDANGTDYAYILNDRYGYKVDVATGVIDETKDFGANSVCGRPVLFEGNWRIPLGDTNDAQTLTTVGIPAAADTYTAITGIKARHFAALQDKTVANFARARLHNVSLSADASSFGSEFEVGDSSLKISDLLVVAGELMPVKPDGPWSFDADGNSLPIIETVGRSLLADEYDGSDSHGHGAYAYWAGSAGLWRVLGDRATPIGAESDPAWVNAANLGVAAPFLGISNQVRWASVVAWGRWIYASILSTPFATGDVFVGYIRDDGTVLWHGSLYRAASLRTRVTITGPAGGTDGPILWIVGTGKIRGMKLGADGSPRTSLGNFSRGDASLRADFILSEDDFDLPDKEKQWRRMWAYVEGLPGDGTMTVGFYAYRDRDGGAIVGAAISSDGYTSRDLTPGSSDKAFAMQPGIRFTATGGYDPTASDPRVRSFGYEARTATIYQATIPAVPDELRGGVGVEDALQNLRRLLGASRVAIGEPDINATFNGEIVGVQEEAVPTDSGTGYKINVLIQRWDVT